MLSPTECEKLRDSVVKHLESQVDDCQSFDFDRTKVLNTSLAELLYERLQSYLDVLLPGTDCYVHPIFAYTRYNGGGHLGFHRDGHNIENGSDFLYNKHI